MQQPTEKELKEIAEKINEASYEGNIGFMELAKFHQKATPDEKKQLKTHIDNKQHKDAWGLVQKVTGTVLHKSALGESNISPDILDVSGAGQEGTDTLVNTYKSMTPGQSTKKEKKFKDFR